MSDGQPHRPTISVRLGLAEAGAGEGGAVEAAAVAQGVVLTDADLARLMTAVGRINQLAESFA